MTRSIMRVAKRVVSGVGVVAVLGTTMVAESATAQPPLPTTETVMAGQEITWQDCGDGLRCGTLTVPADWSDLTKPERINLGLAKLPARDPSRKVGTLLHSPGGPAQAIEYLPFTRDSYADLTEWFDVVIFDPRGFGRSSGVSCPRQAPVLLEWASPEPAAYAEFAAANRTFARECAAAIGSLRGKLNSWQVAHDMDAIRVALGDAELNYFGNSYGTVFGQAYAELFDDRVARMYLDSVLDHTDGDLYSWAAGKAVTAERNLHRFAQWCDGETTCALHGQDVLAVWDRVIARAEREPIPAPADGPDAAAGAALIRGLARLTYEAGWPDTALALAQADAGDASLFVPTLPPPPGSLAPDLSRVMMCADFPYQTRYGTLKRTEGRLRDQYAPRLGYIHAWSTAAVFCAGLPQNGTFPPHSIRPRDLPPVLVASGSNDQTTPPEHARRVTGQLPGARYLPTEGAHALYLSGNACVRGNVHRYLLTGQLPPADTRC